MFQPYTYLIGWSAHKIFYYGAQWGRSANPTNLWTTYFTSSKAVLKYREEFGEPDIKQIRKIFESAEICWTWENRVLQKLGAKNNIHYLNRSNGYGSYACNKGTIPVKDKNGTHLGRISVNDPRLKTRDVVHICTDLPGHKWTEKEKQQKRELFLEPSFLRVFKEKMKMAMNKDSTRKLLVDSHVEENCIHCGVKMRRPAIDLYHNSNCPTVTNKRAVAPATGRKWFNNGSASFMKLVSDDLTGLTVGRLRAVILKER